MITNHHCVPGIIENERLGASAILAVQFRLGYVRDGIEEGTEMFLVNPIPLETNKALDYSVLEIIGGDANAHFGALQLSAVRPSDKDPFWVIGHPMGEAQRISREKCQADNPAIASGKLRHTCDTLPGNSGSPVIDAGLQQVVALHHAGSRAGAVNFAIPMADILSQSKILKAALAVDVDAERKQLSDELAALRAERDRLAAEAEARAAIAPAEVPDGTAPEDAVPEDAVPEDTVPEDTVPEDTVPEDTVPVQLIGIFGDASSPRALVRLENGQYERITVGDPLDGGVVTAIDKTALRYEKDGKDILLGVDLTGLRADRDRLAAEAEAARFGLAPGDLGLRIDVTGSGATGTVVIDLFEDVAPGHAERIAGLARTGAYDGVIWHRVIDDFMAQTGDVRFGDITEKTFTIAQSGGGGSEMPDLKAEFSDLSFKRGVVGMARAADPDSANSQFFIMFKDGPYLNGQYTVIGKVIAGMEVVDKIKRGDNSSWATVGEPDRMARVTVID